VSDENTQTKPPKLIDDAVRSAALDILTAAKELGEWDLPPALVVILNRDGVPTYVPVPVPDGLWYEAHPAVVLNSLSTGLAAGAVSLRVGEDQATMLQASGDLAGLILFTEGHAVLSENMNEAERETLDDFAKRHRLENHPKASELRMANMIDRHLTVALAQHVRGKDVDDRIVYGFTGRIPDALSRVASTLMSTWMEEAQKTI
jgi:hypothetical protein